MNGAENLRGIDYQISYALLHLLQCLVVDGALPHRITLEDLDDEGADMILEWEQRPELLIQIKKLSEGYQWTIGRLAAVIQKFCDSEEASSYMFVTNGQGNRDVTTLKRAIREGAAIPQEVIDGLVSEECSQPRIAEILTRLQIWTRCFPSDDDADPALGLRREVERILTHQRFRITKPLQDVSQELWSSVFEMARSGRAMTGDFVLGRFTECGLLLSTITWSRYPGVGRYYAHSVEIDTMLEMMENAGLILVTGIGGSGKTALVAEASSRSSAEGNPVCWIDTNALLNPESFVETVASYMADLGLEVAARRLRDTPGLEKPSELIHLVQANALRVVVDRADRASEKLSVFLELAVQACPTAAAGSFILTSRSIPDWWEETAAMKERACIIRLHGLPSQSAINLLMDADLGLSEEECIHLAERVDGHPQSLNLLCRATDASAEIDASIAVEAVRTWILGKVLQELPSDVRAALSSLSIYGLSSPAI